MKKKTLFIVKGIFLMFFALYTIIPFMWLFVTSLKTNGEYYASRFSMPDTLQFINYYKAWNSANLGRLIANSFFVSCLAMIINLIVASMACYVLSRYNFKGRKLLFIVFTSGVMVPLNSLMLPYYFIYNKLGWINSLTGLTILYVAIGIPVSIFIIKGDMDELPKEVEEAAYVDGCNFFQRFVFVVLPMARGGVFTAATFQFVTCWNEFVYANLLVNSTEKKTIQVGIRYFTSQFATDYVTMYAAIMITIIPSILMFILLQGQIIHGMSAGALKG